MNVVDRFETDPATWIFEKLPFYLTRVLAIELPKRTIPIHPDSMNVLTNIWSYIEIGFRNQTILYKQKYIHILLHLNLIILQHIAGLWLSL